MGRFSDAELESLAALLGRLPLRGKDCTVEHGDAPVADRRPRPVYWKPTYPTRVMRERAFAKRELERERICARRPALAAGRLRRAASRRTSSRSRTRSPARA